MVVTEQKRARSNLRRQNAIFESFLFRISDEMLIFAHSDEWIRHTVRRAECIL